MEVKRDGHFQSDFKLQIGCPIGSNNATFYAKFFANSYFPLD